MDKAAPLINIDENFDFAVSEIVKLFNNGNVFIYPTDTIYGIGGNPFIESVVDRINKIKKRDLSKQYIYLVDSVTSLKNLVIFNSDEQINILKKIWPNPVSVILNLNKETSRKLKIATAAFRIPDDRFCHKFLAELRKPVISTSVNKVGELPLNDYNLIQKEFKNNVNTIFYSNKQREFIQSTIIDFTAGKPEILRKGKINFVDLMNNFG